jgi:CRISPR-associated protein Cas5d
MNDSTPKNSISFKLSGRYALFTDPITRIGGEKCSYQIPTYEALKGVLKSIYWKPTLIWVVDKVRVIKPIRTQTKGTKPLVWSGGNSLAIYTFLHDVEYQVQAHFIWNEHRPELANDRVDGKHYAVAKRMLDKGGRQDVFLGTRDCQGYVEPCEFGEGSAAYDDLDELGFGLMFHGFDYPDEGGKDESGKSALCSRFWRATMKHGVIEFPLPENCEYRQFIREMEPKKFEIDKNVKNIVTEETEL